MHRIHAREIGDESAHDPHEPGSRGASARGRLINAPRAHRLAPPEATARPALRGSVPPGLAPLARAGGGTP